MTDSNHPTRFISTICRHSGRQCQAALAVAHDLARSDMAGRCLSPDFEMTGFTHLAGCRETCQALFRLSPSGVELYCGVAPDADPDELAALAATFCDMDSGPIKISGNPPLAIVVSVPRRQRLARVSGAAI